MSRALGRDGLPTVDDSDRIYKCDSCGKFKRFVTRCKQCNCCQVCCNTGAHEARVKEKDQPDGD